MGGWPSRPPGDGFGAGCGKLGRIVKVMNRIGQFLMVGALGVTGGLRAEGEADFVSGVRQLTFEGKRAGEGYFNKDGTKMVFQSEREAGNPFYQIYVLDLETGDTERISPGTGKTTCAWMHPDGERVMFA